MVRIRNLGTEGKTNAVKGKSFWEQELVVGNLGTNVFN